jgi:hypothetical protein
VAPLGQPSTKAICGQNLNFVDIAISENNHTCRYLSNKILNFALRSEPLLRLPNWGNSGKNCSLNLTETTSKSSNDLFDLHGLKNFQPIAPSQAVSVSVNAGEKVVLSYLIKGTHKEIAKLGLMKLKTGNSLSFGNYLTSPELSGLESGNWWLTEHGSSVDNVLPKSEHLDRDKNYVVYFVVKDNDAKYDLDDTPGIILDPTVIGDSSSASVVVDAEIIGTWSNGIRYWDFVALTWTQMSADVGAGDIAAGDFTGDGKADVASSWDNFGLWYQNGATLTWTEIDDMPPGRVTAGDVTGQ